MPLARSYAAGAAKRSCAEDGLRRGRRHRRPALPASRTCWPCAMPTWTRTPLWQDVASRHVRRPLCRMFISDAGGGGRKAEGRRDGAACATIEEYGGQNRGGLSAQAGWKTTPRSCTPSLETILEDQNIDEARILTEAAIFADKTAVDEETVRLRSHIAQYREILEHRTSPVGRKLDFSDPGAEPGDQHHRLQVPGPGHHPHGGGHEGGDREDPRADPESGVTQ